MTLMTPAVWGSYLQWKCCLLMNTLQLYTMEMQAVWEHQRWSSIFFDELKINLTLSGSDVKREVWSCRGQPNPPVQTWVQVFLKKLLYFIIQNESQVSSPSLAPSLGTEKRLLYGYKLIARGIKTFLVVWTWEIICVIVSITGATEEANYQTYQYAESKTFHLCTSRLVSLAGSFMPLKGPNISSPDTGLLFRIVFNIRMALLLGP